MNRQRFQLCLKEGRSGCRIWAPRAIVLQRLSRQRPQLCFKEGRSGCATVQHNRKDAYGGERNLKKFQDISTTPRTLFFHFLLPPWTKKTRFLVLSFTKKKIFWLAWRTGLCGGLCGGEILTSLDDGDDGDVVLFLFRFCFWFLLLQCASVTNKSNDTHPSPKIWIYINSRSSAPGGLLVLILILT